jgi:hypothetical protein
MAVNFALSPALVVNGIIDYMSREGRHIFTYATTKLDEELYNCKPEGLYQFIQAIKGQAHKYGWDHAIGGIIHIPEDAADPASVRNNLYGMISMDQIRGFEGTYINQQLRPVQDTYLIVQMSHGLHLRGGKIGDNHLEQPVHSTWPPFWNPPDESHCPKKPHGHECNNLFNPNKIE